MNHTLGVSELGYDGMPSKMAIVCFIPKNSLVDGTGWHHFQQTHGEEAASEALRQFLGVPALVLGGS